MEDCSFCKRLELAEFCADLAKKESRKNGTERVLREYAVAFVELTWTRAQGKRSAGSLTDYRRRGLGYRLNYCPECGRRIKEPRKTSQ